MEESFGERFKRKRIEAGYTHRTLAKKIGATGATISFWETGKTSPENIRGELLDAAARKLHTTMRYLLTGKLETETGNIDLEKMNGVSVMEDDDDYDPTYGVLVPVYDLEVSGGPGSLNPDWVETRYNIHFTRKWLKRMELNESNMKVVNVRGESMQPTLWDGDKVVVDVHRNQIRSGRIFALIYGDEARVKRLYRLADGSIRVMSDNRDKDHYPDEVVSGEDLNRIRIIGQVVHKMGSGGL